MPAAVPAEDHPLLRPLGEIASRPVISARPQDPLIDAARLLARHPISSLPVLDVTGRALGILTQDQILSALHEGHPPETALVQVMAPVLAMPQDITCHDAYQRCLMEGRSHIVVVDETGRVTGVVSETDFRMRLDLAALAGRHPIQLLMRPVMTGLSPQDTLQQAMEMLQGQDASRCLVVMADGAPVGLLTGEQRRRLFAAHSHASEMRLGEVMQSPVVTLPEQASLNEAAARMLDEHSRHLVVVNAQQQPVGLLYEHDLTRTTALGLMDVTLRQDRALQRAMFNALPDLLWLKDPDGVYLDCNPRLEQLFGRGRSQIVGRSDYDLVSREEAERFRELDRHAMVRNGARMVEEIQRFADGHAELVQTLKTPVRDTKGRLLGVLGIGRDITALREAEAKYRHLFDRSPAPMLIYERGSLDLVAVNEAFCLLYGHDAQQAQQLHLLDLFVPEEREAILALIPTLRGLTNTGQWRHLHRDGRIIHIAARSHDILYEGRDCRVVVVVDITPQVRRQLRDRQRITLLEKLMRGHGLEELLLQIALDHESSFPGSLCTLMLRSEDGQHMRLACAPNMPAGYGPIVDGMVIGPEVGSCGAAIFLGERVLAEDLQTHPNWQPYRALTAELGLGACWAEPIPGPDGQALGSLGIYRRAPGLPDEEELEHQTFAAQLASTILIHHQASQRLRDSRRQLRDILHAIPDLLWLRNPEGRVVSCNQAFAGWLGWRVEQLPGMAEERLFEPATLQILGASDQRVTETRQPQACELWLTCAPSGQRGLFEVLKTPLLDEAGQITGVLSVARDITLIKLGEQAMAERERLIDTMFAQTTDAIVLLEPATLDIVHFNDSACTGMGYSREAFARLHPSDFQAEFDLTRIREMAARTMAGEQIRTETRHRRADGSIQHALLTLRGVTYANRPLLSAVWSDITESKRHEAHIRRLNRAYALLGEVNEAIVRVRDPATLFQEVCRITVETGGFRLAWIGGVQRDAQGAYIAPQAHAGHSDGYAETLRIPCDPAYQGPVNRALSTGCIGVVNDIAQGGLLNPWRDATLARGLRAMATLPIKIGEAVRHCLTVYSDTPEHFDAEQINLLSRLAADIGLALDYNAAERARTQERQLREQLIESVAGLFFAVDQQGRLRMWNRQVSEVTGYSNDEISGHDALDYFAEQDRELVRQRIAQAFTDGQAQVEARLVTRDGRSVPYLFASRRIRIGEELLLAGSAVDISERVRTEHELTLYRQHLEELVATRTLELGNANARLHREDQRLRAMLALSQRANTLTEGELFQAGLELIVQHTNSMAGCLHMVDPASGRFLATSWWTRPGHELPPMPGPGEPNLWLEVVRCRGPVICGADDNASRLCSQQVQRAMGVPIIEDDELRFVICVANKPQAYDDNDSRELTLIGSDLWRIIRRRRIELDLEKAKAEADAANQAKSAFLANMSHEIRTPMNAIIGFAHLLKRDPLSPRQLDHLGKIVDAGRHLSQVINDVLDFSKIEASKLSLEATDFDLHASVTRTADMVRDRAQAKQLTLGLVLDPDCPVQLHGDPLRLEQILLNLLSNAVKFTQRGGVVLRVRPLTADNSSPHWLRFEVEDSGIGMDEAQMQRLFQPFEQADASTTRRFGGTGLGLAICQRLAALMSGRLGVSSQSGQGSTFWLELPFRAAVQPLPQPGAPTPDAAPGPHGLPAAAAQERPAPPRLGAANAEAPLPALGMNVLLAEDNPINQEVASALLSEYGARVSTADNGQIAVELASRGGFDLVLMDMQMPVMDGLRATTLIRALPGAAGQVPVVAMTANAFEEDRRICLEAGMNDYLAKPVDPVQLRRCLAVWGRRAADASSLPAAAAAAGPAAPAATTGLHERLSSVPGLDLPHALARMQGQWPLLLRTLRMFISHYGDLAGPLSAVPEQALPEPELARLHLLGHSLAGAAATIGATQVQRLARALEHCSPAAGDPALRPAQAAHHLARELDGCIPLLRQALEAPEPPPASLPRAGSGTGQPGAVPAGQMQRCLNELDELLNQHDTAACEFFERQRTSLQASLGGQFGAIAQAVQDYDFSIAHDLLRQVMAAQPPQTGRDAPPGAGAGPQ